MDEELALLQGKLAFVAEQLQSFSPTRPKLIQLKSSMELLLLQLEQIRGEGAKRALQNGSRRISQCSHRITQGC
ncbi:hypothetical protein DXV75_03090 [Alteromonas aestuariivivens]|uniref:Uncharacterized protein n=1 Tax=Alteromonas aestuariivivens TaxID=1938339 RepID=A0A3D8MBP3_9ALTE|nr:hypothetical protein [Alteromonas aestuariivivens]RDV27968.1 hypothetical protein DXV75_03090 [Alteromonas aestuariivivens]